MRIALVSFYDNHLAGARALAAYLERRGHTPRFIHLKALYLEIIPRRERDRIKAIQDENPYLALTSYEEGDIFAPTPVPISEREEELFLEDLERDMPDVIGFSILWSAYPAFRRFSSLVRNHFPRLPIIAGGSSVITAPEYFLPFADVACVGEGEEAVAEWLEDPGRTDIRGLWFSRNGSLIKNPRRPLIRDLDALPFPLYGKDEILIENNAVSRELEANAAYLRDKWVFMSSRGCPMRCSFCVEGAVARLYPVRGAPPRRSVDHFLGELKEAVGRLPFTRLHFQDNVFVKDTEWLEEFAEKYRREINLPFKSNAYPGVSTRRMLALVREAGGDEIAVNIQTSDTKILRHVYHRRPGMHLLRKTVRDAADVGFERFHCDIIAHSPYDTEESLHGTFEFLLGLPRPVSLFISHLRRYPGTPICDIEPPENRLPESVHQFWNVLFLLARFREIDRKGLRAIAVDPDIRDDGEVLDEFLSRYVKRLRLLGKPRWLIFSGPPPRPEEVGSWPALRLSLQRRFPHAYVRLMLRKRRRRPPVEVTLPAHQ